MSDREDPQTPEAQAATALSAGEDRSPARLGRDGGGGFVAAARSQSRVATEARTPTRRSARGTGGGRSSIGNSMAVGELIAQLQRIWQRQRFRADERAFARDIEKIVAQLSQRRADPEASGPASQTINAGYSSDSSCDGASVHSSVTLSLPFTQAQSHPSDSSSDSGTDISVPSSILTSSHRAVADSNVEVLLNAMDALFRHRYQEVRLLAFEIINLCLTNYGEQLTATTRQRIFQQLEDHDQTGDSEQLQKTLRLLTSDGRRVEPFNAELGWLLLQWLEESDEQRDLLNLIQQILRRSPLSLDFETVIAITSVVCGRCDVAWSRGDVETCRRFLSFFHVLATHRLEHALGTSVSLRTLCWMVNADGQGTWSVMKHLLNSSAGFQVLRGLVTLLENPIQHNQWILRGAVFFVGMSCWGSQRVSKLDDIKWAPILLALEACLECENGVVVFEIILAIQRLVKKYGDCKSPNQKAMSATSSSVEKRLVVEWDIILRMFRTMRPWLSANVPSPPVRSPEGENNGSISRNSKATSQGQGVVPVHMTRIPKELLDTLHVVTELVCDGKFGGEIDDFFDVLQDYFAFLPETALRLLLRRKAEQAHPAHHADWLYILQDTLETFFLNRQVPSDIRNEALELLQVNLWSSRNVCEDRVVEEVLLPMMSEIYDDPELTIRRKALDLITEVARTLESVRFDALLDILERAVQLSVFEDSQTCAIAGVVSLFSSYFNHLPQSRALRMYDIITSVVESHRNWEVRHCALKCLLLVCESSSDYRLRWRDTQIRTSRFLFSSRRAVRNQQTGAFLPIQRGLRALLTLISTESHALLFRMAVEGLRRMLQNRVILSDIDINDTAMKIISCVDYQAFGRAAIADEISALLAEMDAGVSSVIVESNSRAVRARSESSSGESNIRSSRNHVPIRIDVSAVKTNLREAAALLCKIRFTTMGLQLLELFMSYMSELTQSVRHHLVVCILGAMDTQPQISESDLAISHEDDHDASSTHSGSAWIWPSRPRSKSSTVATASLGSSSGDERGSQQVAQLSVSGNSSTPEPKVTSPQQAFTSRMLLKLQSSAHHSGLFNALSSSTHGAGTNDRTSAEEAAAIASAARRDRELLQRCLRLVFEAEFSLLHTATNAVSLLGHIAPDVVAARLDMLLRSSKNSFSTPDGSFRGDAYSAVIEMIGNVVVIGSVLRVGLEQKARILEDFVLVAFRRHLEKATTYLAYRTLCEILFQCKEKDHRVTLATRAIPCLRETAAMPITDHSLVMAEVAIDFLMCFALSRSDLIVAPALGVKAVEPKETQNAVSQRSWIYHNTIITIELHPKKPALLIVRRPSSTSRWHLAMHQQHSQPFDTSLLVKSDVVDLVPSLTARATVNEIPPVKERILPVERVRTLPPFRPPIYGQSDTKPNVSSLKWKPSKTSSRHPAFTGLPPHHLPVPPLPAYDGIGGSPSFFCEPSTPMIEGNSMESLLLDSEEQDRAQPLQDETVVSPVTDAVDSDQLGQITLKQEGNTESDGVPTVNNSEDRGTEMSLTFGEQSGEEVTSPVAAVDDESSKAEGENAFVREVSVDPPFDPSYLMMQLFDLGVDDRPNLLTDGPSLTLGLNVLDRTPEFETHKIGVLYVRSSKRRTEVEILKSFGGSVRYLTFLRALGAVTTLEGLQGFAGGMDTSIGCGDGKCTLMYRSHSFQMVFHVSTMMNSLEDLKKEVESADSTNDRKSTISTTMKKRHIGNDFVHIIFKECDDEYDVRTFSGQFNDVHIIVQPLNDHEFRTIVKCKPGIPPFGPLYGTQVIPSTVVAQCVRQTALNANLACHAYHQELIGFKMNCEERLKQIKQLGARLATHSDEWTLGA